jgi:predicted membrane protein
MRRNPSFEELVQRVTDAPLETLRRYGHLLTSNQLHHVHNPWGENCEDEHLSDEIDAYDAKLETIFAKLPKKTISHIADHCPALFLFYTKSRFPTGTKKTPITREMLRTLVSDTQITNVIHELLFRDSEYIEERWFHILTPKDKSWILDQREVSDLYTYEVDLPKWITPEDFKFFCEKETYKLENFLDDRPSPEIIRHFCNLAFSKPEKSAPEEKRPWLKRSTRQLLLQFVAEGI